METFWHYNDSAESVGDLLTPAWLFSRELTLWAPSSQLINENYRQGNCALRDYDILALVENGYLRIAGRTEWLVNGDMRRKSESKLAEWGSVFDTELLRIFEEDKSVEKPRVYAVDAPRGYVIADQEIDSKSAKYELALRAYRNNMLTKGTSARLSRLLEKKGAISDNERHRLAAREVLRDAVNHEDARLAAGAAMSVDENLETSIINSALVDRTDVQTSSSNDFDGQKVSEAIEIARSFAGLETVDQLIRIRQDAREQNFIWDLQQAELGEMRQRLAHQIRMGADDSSFADGLFGKKLEQKTAYAAQVGVVAYAASKAHSEQNPNRRSVIFGVAAVVLGGLPGALTLAGEGLEHASWVGERDYTGPTWLSVLAFGTSQPTRSENEIMIGKLMI